MKLVIKGFDWDKGNQEKCRKHGVSLAAIERVFMSDDVWLMPDVAHSTEEDRFIAIAPVDKRYVFVVFTERSRRIRPVSARYMHKDEVEYYEEKIDT